MIGRISENLNRINSNINAIRQAFGIPYEVKLLAVSKLQNSELIMEAYNSGQRDFAENYIDELIGKATSLPEDINWHMIGHIQSNKCSKLLRLKNLKFIHTIDSLVLALRIDKILKNNGSSIIGFIQVNTSGEATKAGIQPGEAIQLGKDILEKCLHIKIQGFMTIGEAGSAQDFIVLREVRKAFAESTGVEENTLELSMGMSGDYEEAIKYGSNYVRIGTSIFGARDTTK